MADRKHDRPAADDYDRGGDPHPPASAESDPLAELARLIGRTDPFGSMGRANQPLQPHGAARDEFQQPADADERPPAGPPPWMQRAARQGSAQQDPQQDYPGAVHPLHRYATPQAASETVYDTEPHYADEHEPDPARYDDALYGRLDAGAQESQYDPAYLDDAEGYPDSYADGPEDQVRKRGRGLMTVAAVLALAVVGTGAAFAYRTYLGSPRSGEPPIIRADASPTKIVPAPGDGSAKVPDRLAAGDGSEKIVPREEAPVDVNTKSGPRVVFPPLNSNAYPPSMASVAPGTPPPASAGNGTLPSNEPRKIKTLAVRGDQPDAAATLVTSAVPPSARPTPAARLAGSPGTPATRSPASAANANASGTSAPLLLTPGAQPAAGAETRTRVAATNPSQATPNGAGAGGGYVVQISSQRNEADAQASYRALQSKFPSVLGSRTPLIKRADLGDKGVYYRAMVGPFGSTDEAAQFCGSLKTAGGQCVVQKN